MTNASDTLTNPQAGSEMAPLRAKSGWIIALGVVYLLAGFIALGSVMMATVASVLIVGVMMIIAGVAEVFSAFQIKSWGKFLLWVLLGVLYIVAGFVTFENPLLAAVLLTLVLGASLVASGIMRIILAFSNETGNAMDLGGAVRCDHAAARPLDFGAMAGLEPLYPRPVPWHRSHHGWRWLDRIGFRPASRSLRWWRRRTCAPRG
jgi:uncharacterized membrane protein HdeD (DUF308 family)